MTHHYQHIKNVYVAKAKIATDKEHCTLVIETDLNLAHAGHDERLDILLMDVHRLKQRCPAMFSAVDEVEIRERRPTPRLRPADNYFYIASPANSDFRETAAGKRRPAVVRS